MKSRLGSILQSYFGSWWLPAACCFALLGLFTIAALLAPPLPFFVPNAALIGLLLALLGILAAAIWNLAKRRWGLGFGNLAMLAVGVVITLFCLGVVMLASFFGPSEDHFADNLCIPSDLAVSQPLDELRPVLGTSEDAFQARLLAALKTPGGGDPSVTADLTSLVRLQQQHPGILQRYLAASPAWRVFTERGDIFATRRWMIDSHWQYSLHGYYSRSDIDLGAEPIPYFQSRTTICLSGVPWARSDSEATRFRAGTTTRATLSEGNQMVESHCVVTAGGLIIELFEQSEANERRLTQAALEFLDEEFRPLAQTPSWTTIQAVLPTGSIRVDAPSFELRNADQPGIYNSELWINPGEPGMVYLRAFEATQGTPLSGDRLKERSSEWIGWSEDPQQLFYSNTHFTVYEGDWGKPYAARFEVWFAPDSGAAERKLIEKVFKIEGWQR